MIFNTYGEQKNSVNGITLVSAGHIFAKKGREILRPNGRDDWLLFFVAKEEETFYFENVKICKAGGFVLFAPGEPQHHIYKGDKTAEFYYVHFKCDALPDNINLKTRKVYNLSFGSQVCDTFEYIIDEMQKRAPHYEKLCTYRLLGLLSEIERAVAEKSEKKPQSFNRIAKAVQYMNRYYNEDTSLEDFAKMCNMSKYHFLRTFLQITGKSPIEYRNDIRLSHAAEMLTEERLSVEEVGATVGYSSASYFSSAFKKKFSVSPKQYQKTAH